MAVHIGDRILQTTTTSGTDTYQLFQSVQGYATFRSIIPSGSTVYYVCEDGDGNWEIGEGIFTQSTVDTITRNSNTTITSNGPNTLISWPSGGIEKRIFLAIPAAKQLYLNESGNLDSVTIDSLTANNTLFTDGVKIEPENAPTSTHKLVLRTNSTITGSDKNLNLNTGNTTRTLTINGDATLVSGTMVPTSQVASPTAQGIVELATDAETQTGTDAVRAITPAGLTSRTATETRTGLIELATAAEVNTGSDTTRAVTPLHLNTYYARKAINITAGNGLSGGGDISANRTITLGTPTSINSSSTNTVASTSHTHALDNSSINWSKLHVDTITGLSSIIHLHDSNMRYNTVFNDGYSGMIQWGSTNNPAAGGWGLFRTASGVATATVFTQHLYFRNPSSIARTLNVRIIIGWSHPNNWYNLRLLTGATTAVANIAYAGSLPSGVAEVARLYSTQPSNGSGPGQGVYTHTLTFNTSSNTNLIPLTVQGAAQGDGSIMYLKSIFAWWS